MVSQVAITRFGALFAVLLVACAEGYDPSLDDNARAIDDELEQKAGRTTMTRITKTKLFMRRPQASRSDLQVMEKPYSIIVACWQRQR